MRKGKSIIWLSRAGFFLVFIFSALLFLAYFEGRAKSDFVMHVNFAMTGESYSLLGLFFYLIMSILKSELALALFMSLMICGTIYGISFFVKDILLSLGVEKIELWQMVPLGLSSIFLCNIYIPKWCEYFYTLEAVVTQPWHNPTYILMRLIGIFVLVVYWRLEKKYLNHFSFKDALCFTILLILVNAAKPNFIIGFAPMMLIFLFYDFVKTKGKSFLPALKFGSCVLVSLLVLIFQAKVLFVEGDGTGIILNWEWLLSLRPNIEMLWKLLAGFAFPLFATLILVIAMRKNLAKLKILLQSWIMFIIARSQAFLFLETGRRAGHGNFYWGGFFFAYILYMVCIVMWIYAYKKGIVQNKIIYYLGYILYGLNIISGIIYFIFLLTGEEFLI